jgi:hypothetical protein
MSEAVTSGEPAIDRLAAAMLNLASELWVQTEKLTTLTMLVQQKGLVSDAELAELAASCENDPAREEQLRGFIERVMTPLRERA